MNWDDLKFRTVVVLQIIGKVLLVLFAILWLFYLFDPDKPENPYSSEENRERYR